VHVPALDSGSRSRVAVDRDKVDARPAWLSSCPTVGARGVGFGTKRPMCSMKVQQPQQRLWRPIDPQQLWDLRQQPPPTTLPVVRIEGRVDAEGAVAGFWPDNSAQRCQMLRTVEQRSGRSQLQRLVVDTRVALYGSEGWGFESLRARPGQQPLPIMEGAFVLTPFDRRDAAVFSGREPEIDRLIELLTCTLLRGPRPVRGDRWLVWQRKGVAVARRPAAPAGEVHRASVRAAAPSLSPLLPGRYRGARLSQVQRAERHSKARAGEANRSERERSAARTRFLAR
jgi:hypothetical protein